MLHWHLDWTQPDAEGRPGLPRLPINQLTWAEVARQCLVCHVMKELHRPWEDVQSLVRGAKVSAAYRNAKNVARYIRYRWEIRLRGAGEAVHASTSSSLSSSSSSLSGGGSSASSAATAAMAAEAVGSEGAFDELYLTDRLQWLPGNVPVPLVAPSTLPTVEYGDIFESEGDVVAALAAASSRGPHSDVYKRCMKVRDGGRDRVRARVRARVGLGLGLWAAAPSLQIHTTQRSCKFPP